ncbi:MAG: hypothetical protein P0S94_01925, partial [Simkaniaceae bacterium]|nr:hypothetical protein [Simkaniaceae bacterium]
REIHNLHSYAVDRNFDIEIRNDSIRLAKIVTAVALVIIVGVAIAAITYGAPIILTAVAIAGPALLATGIITSVALSALMHDSSQNDAQKRAQTLLEQLGNFENNPNFQTLETKLNEVLATCNQSER